VTPLAEPTLGAGFPARGQADTGERPRLDTLSVAATGLTDAVVAGGPTEIAARIDANADAMRAITLFGSPVEIRAASATGPCGFFKPRSAVFEIDEASAGLAAG
jgi:hypothetical protein